jgi:hypothetical protein
MDDNNILIYCDAGIYLNKDGIERFFLCFHKLFSDFGRSLLLPLLWLVILGFLFFGINIVINFY